MLHLQNSTPQFSEWSTNSITYCEILQIQLQLLNFLSIFVPRIIFHDCDVNIYQLAGKTWELIINAYRVVATRRCLFGIISSGLPLIWLHNLILWITNSKAGHAITTTYNLNITNLQTNQLYCSKRKNI